MMNHILPVDKLRPIVEQYLRRCDDRHWNRDTSIPWSLLDRDRLSAGDRDAVRFITHIENHVPWYTGAIVDRFAVAHARSYEEYASNRELYRFVTRWNLDEDRHSDVLRRYQIEASIATEDDLDQQLYQEGVKEWTFVNPNPFAIFAYTVIQEKATEIFYKMLLRKTEEPVLIELLRLLQRDESRHFAFYAQILQTAIEHHGPEAIVPLQESLDSFCMPMAAQLTNYWRWSIKICDYVGGFDHSEAYPYLIRVIEKAAHARSNSKTTPLNNFVSSLQHRYS